ncbi:MAG: hypothetical protein II008_06110 [Oscillospiraceae bacterium]|nr:hypothetical protein [Oscillospiraceae bacterium]
MVFKIGDVDITPYITPGGLKWSRNDLEGSSAGRLQNGDMHRDRLATKYQWDITCRLLTAAEQATILALIQPEYITVQYTDPLTNTTKIGRYYSNNFPSTYMVRRANGTEYWAGLAFPIIQV